MKKMIILALFGLSIVSCSEPNTKVVIYQQNTIVDTFKLSQDSLQAKKITDSISQAENKSYEQYRIVFVKDSIKAAKETAKEIAIERAKHAKYQKIMDKFDCSEEEADLFLKHRIWIGMSYKMLTSMRGLPNHINTSNYGDGNQYQACWYDYNPSCFYFNSTQIITAYN